MAISKEQRDELLADMQQILLAYMAEPTTIPGYRPTKWLYPKAGNMYIRPASYHNVGNPPKPTDCFDFANMTIHDEYRGCGLMMELMEWWNNGQNPQPYTFVESVINADQALRLTKAGWTKCGDEACPNFYKQTVR